MPDDYTCNPCARGEHDDCEPTQALGDGVRGFLVCLCRRRNHGQPEPDVALPEATDDPPEDPVQALVNAAAWLDGYDRLALGIARQLPADRVEERQSLEATAAGDQVQVYLLRMARWLAERPALAAMMWADTLQPPGDAT